MITNVYISSQKVPFILIQF